MTAMIGMAGPVSGAALNPAVGIVQTVFQALVIDHDSIEVGDKRPGFGSMWIYIFGPFVGGILAALWTQYYIGVLKAAELGKFDPDSNQVYAAVCKTVLDPSHSSV